MKRRTFLKNTGAAVSLPFIMNGMSLYAMARPFSLERLSNESDRVLVLIQLNGGNDGLNTVIPLDQYRNLHHARPNVIIPENDIIPVKDTLGFHPVLTGMKSLFEQEDLEIIQSVGYPQQNRSHFRSMEIWSNALIGENETHESGSGWLGRYLNDLHPDFPEGYPNGQYTDPFAISMGHFVSETCQGKTANFSMAMQDPSSLSTLPADEASSDYGPFYRDELAFIQNMIRQTNGYADAILKADDHGNSLVNYPETRMGEQLRNVAKLISGGLRTKIYIVSLVGFDTHAGQVDNDDTSNGEHASLLKTLSDAVKAFQDDLRQLGLEERVIGMTYSEFGRQIRSNASNGTDHGAAAPLFLFGSCVQPQILGHNPEIAEEVEVQEAVPMQYDFRDVYGSLLMHWFGFPLEDTRRILYSGFQPLPILKDCGPKTEAAPPRKDSIKTNNYPNPFQDWTVIHFDSGRERVRLSILNTLGIEIEVLMDKNLNAGSHEVRFDGRDLPGGSYFYRLVMEEGRQVTQRMVKVQS